MSQSAKNQKISLFIFLIGVLSFVGVIYMLFFAGTKKNISNSEAQNTPDSIAKSTQSITESINEKLPNHGQNMDSPSAETLNGSWKVTFGESMAVLTIHNEGFQIITSEDSTGQSRRYSRGKIQYNPETGILTLLPSTTADAPAPIKGVTYNILTNNRSDIRVKQSPNDPALYLTALEKDVPGRTYHPLFSYADFNGIPVLKFIRLENKNQETAQEQKAP